MAHFAKLDDNNIVEQVIVVHNNELLDENGIEQEQNGIDFCVNLLGGRWIQTSYNSNFRKQYAGVGYTYNADKDIFIAPSPFASWVLNEDNDWVAPVARPDGRYKWDETTLNWVEFTLPTTSQHQPQGVGQIYANHHFPNAWRIHYANRQDQMF